MAFEGRSGMNRLDRFKGEILLFTQIVHMCYGAHLSSLTGKRDSRRSLGHAFGSFGYR